MEIRTFRSDHFDKTVIIDIDSEKHSTLLRINLEQTQELINSLQKNLSADRSLTGVINVT